MERAEGERMSVVWRALLLGVGFGLASTAVGQWLQLVGVVERRMGAALPLTAQIGALEILLGALLGLCAAPLLRARGGVAWHVLAMALAWYGLERWVTLDAPLFARFELAQPAGGAALTGLGAWVSRRRRMLPWAAGGVLLAGAMAAPGIYLRLTTPQRPPRAALRPPPPGAPDVVLVVLDTVRASNVSTYGYERPTAAALDALAAEGALFLDATSPSTSSLPSHASLFTGRYPSSHGAHGEHRFLDGRYPTLAEALALHGYDTFCFTANAWISDGLGLTRGFGYQDTSLLAHGGV